MLEIYTNDFSEYISRNGTVDATMTLDRQEEVN